MGLVEGVATAADWPTEELTPHQASAALHRLELAPDISQIVGASGFWTQSSGRAYTLVGSFVRYLIDEYGIEPFKAAYPTGDFESAYDKSALELVEEWRAMLDDLSLSDREMELARYLYDRPSIFDKVCARQIGELEREARAAADRGRLGEMQKLYETILDYAPDNLEHRVSYARAFSRAGEHKRAIEMVEALLDERPDASPVWRARLSQLQGDLAWRLDEFDKAKASYRSCAERGVTTDIHRLLEVKLEALDRPSDQGRSDAFEYLLGRQPGAVKLYYPMRWHQRSPGDPVAAYLIGRRLWNERQWERATPYLEQAAEELQPAILLDETARMLGVAHYFQGELSRAERALDHLDDSEHPYYREQAREWRDRIAWKGGNRIRTQ
ncbi:MAG: tetratricopeptide repeat protein [Persicimonas sp.]